MKAFRLLDRNGFVCLDRGDDNDLLDTASKNTSFVEQRNEMYRWITHTRTKRGIKGMAGRRLLHVPIERCMRKFERFFETFVFTTAVNSMLNEYLGEQWYVRGATIISVPPNASTQPIHRDYTCGRKKSVSIVLTLNEGLLHTLVEPKSHKQTYDVQWRSPTSEQREAQLEKMTDVNSSMFAYDPFVKHAGNATAEDSENDARLFIICYAADLCEEDYKDMDSGHAFE